MDILFAYAFRLDANHPAVNRLLRQANAEARLHPGDPPRIHLWEILRDMGDEFVPKNSEESDAAFDVYGDNGKYAVGFRLTSNLDMNYDNLEPAFVPIPQIHGSASLPPNFRTFLERLSVKLYGDRTHLPEEMMVFWPH